MNHEVERVLMSQLLPVATGEVQEISVRISGVQAVGIRAHHRPNTCLNLYRCANLFVEVFKPEAMSVSWLLRVSVYFMGR
jgi:hypothetical protein